MILNSNIRNLGTLTKRSNPPAGIMEKITSALGKPYPVQNSTYRIGDLTMLFPMKNLPNILADCDWGLIAEDGTDLPLAVFPDITPQDADTLRCYLCCTAEAPMVFYHRPSRAVYLAYMHHDWTIGTWFSLAVDDFLHGDIDDIF